MYITYTYIMYIYVHICILFGTFMQQGQNEFTHALHAKRRARLAKLIAIGNHGATQVLHFTEMLVLQ